jgi:hypothetical protein
MVIKKVFKIQQKVLYIAQTMAIYRFSKGMVGIFIPFVILQGGGTLPVVAGYFLLRASGKLLLNFPAIQLIQRYGAHFGLSTGFAFDILQLACIFGFVSTQELTFLLLAGSSAALADAFSDNARHMFIPRVLQDEARSSSIATLEIMGQTADLLGPLVGAGIGILFGADWLLIAALAVLALTYFPLRHIGRAASFDGTEPIRFTLRAAPKRDLVANFCQCSDEAIALMAWPVYLAVFLGTFESIGAVAAATAFVTMAVVWLAGHLGDRGRLEPVLRQGTLAMSVTNVLRTIALTPVPIALAGSAYMASREYMSNPWNATYYTHVRRKGLQYLFAVETAAGLGYTFVWSLLFALVLLLGDARIVFVIGFLLAAVLIWGTFLLTRLDARGRSVDAVPSEIAKPAA